MFNLNILFGALTIIPQLGTLVNSTVEEMENMLGQVPGMTGAQKFAAVEAKVTVIIQDIVQDAGALQTVLASLKTLINSAVAAFNAAGIFKHASTPVAGA